MPLQLDSISLACKDYERAIELSPSDEGLRKESAEVHAKMWAWPVAARQNLADFVKETEEVQVHVKHFAALSGHSPEAVEKAVIADASHAASGVLKHADDGVGLLMDAVADQKECYAQLAAVEVKLMKAIIPAIEGQRSDTQFYKSLRLHACGGVSMPSEFFQGLAQLFSNYGAKEVKHAKPDPMSREITFEKEDFELLALQLRMAAVHQQTMMDSSEAESLPVALVALMQVVLPRHKEASASYMDEEDPACGEEESMVVKDAVSAFLLGARDVITAEQRALYKAEHGGASLDDALEGGVTCTPCGPCQPDHGTSEELVQVQDHKGLHEWILQHLTPDQQQKLNQVVAVHAKTLKEKRLAELSEAAQKTEDLDRRNRAVEAVLSEDQLDSMQAQHSAMLAAETPAKRAALLEEFERWQGESITEEQRAAMHREVGKDHMVGEIVSHAEANVDEALFAEERTLLVEMGMASELVTMYDSLVGMQKHMCANPQVAGREKDILKDTHDKWIAEQLTVEQYTQFKAKMGAVCDRLMSEHVNPMMAAMMGNMKLESGE